MSSGVVVGRFSSSVFVIGVCLSWGSSAFAQAEPSPTAVGEVEQAAADVHQARDAALAGAKAEADAREKEAAAKAAETHAREQAVAQAEAAAAQTAEASSPEPAFEPLERAGKAEPAESQDGLQVDAGAEYRVRSLRIDPVELSGTTVTDIGWTEQRARLHAKVRKPGLGAITLQVDALDGVLFGDNGSFVGPPPNSNSGVSLSTKRPNLTRWDIGLRPGGDPLTRDDYGPVLVPANPLEINYLYADIYLPVGLLRIGRQPLNYGATITSNDGGRYNRWGVSKYSDGVDRFLFGTKLDEIVKAIMGKNHEPDMSIKNGVIWALFYDVMKQDDVSIFSDDLRQYGTAVQWRAEHADWFGLNWHDFLLSQSAVHLTNQQFDSSVFGFPFQFQTYVGPFRLEAQYIHIQGRTEEISEGFAALANKKPVSQKLQADGARAVADWKVGPVTLTLEGDYASGDADPRSSTPLTSFSFARDLNVGLLMFEHILAFESARSVAVGIENLSGADVDSFPLTEAKTDGRFTNAVAAFPQLDIQWLNLPKHKLHTRFGVLLAWSAAKGGVVDPILTSLAEDGKRIDDDAVNFFGGRPANFYGTEIDGQIGYNLGGRFDWVVEGAMLVPGAALYDENGDAVNSFLVENRFVLSL